jgi:drug/metabolite transporter (DMT)-like permease
MNIEEVIEEKSKIESSMSRALVAKRTSSRALAVAEGLIANLIWASSFVLVKIALEHMGPLTIAGLRYFLAFVILLPFLVRNGKKIRILDRSHWLKLFAIGFSAYTIGNGALFWGMKFLPATTASFLMSLLPLMVLFAGGIWLGEKPGRLQVLGVFIGLFGSLLFFSGGLQPGQPLGISAVLVGLVAFLIFAILGREIARERQVDTLSLTAFPLAFGGGLLLLIALPIEGWPGNAPIAWMIVIWLAIINTAIAYILYNRSLQVLTALEINVLLNLGPFGTAFLAFFLLGETLSTIQITGMVIVVAGVIFVQARSR